MKFEPLGQGQNILSFDICSTANSQFEQDIEDLRGQLKQVEKERDDWENSYWSLLNDIGGVGPN